MKIRKVLCFILIFGPIFFVGIYHELLREYGFAMYYKHRVMEHEIRTWAPPGYPSELGAEGIRVIGGLSETANPDSKVTRFSYVSWYDHRDASVYYAFRNEGDHDIIIHSKVFPVLFGWGHLKISANKELFVRIADSNPADHLQTYAFTLTFRPCASMLPAAGSGFITLLFPASY